jgi:hypothetical protein
MSTSSVYWTETTTALTANGTFTGTSRDAYGVGTAAGVSQFAYFNVAYYSDQAGTAYIDYSTDGSTWTLMATSALTAASSIILSVPVNAQFFRARYVNGATNQATFVVRSSFTVS